MKDYNCPTCKKMIPVDRSKIKAGDEVSFCRVTQSSKSARFLQEKELSIAVKVMWF